MSSPLHKPSHHESGRRHSNGEARYVDDIAAPPGTLVALVVPSPAARGRITTLDVSAAAKVAGVHAVLTAQDIPGINDIAPVAHDEPLLATDEVFCVGQSVALVVGDSYAACRAGAKAIDLQIEALPAIVDMRTALAQGSTQGESHVIQRGDVQDALSGAHLRFSGEIETGGQDHFYLETHAALVLPGESGALHIYSSSQHPSEVQAKVAEVLNLSRHDIVVETPRMGGGFGGKETQGAHFAAMAALAVRATGRPVKVWLNRDQDMMQTGKRHPFYSKYEAGFDAEGYLVGLDVQMWADGGWSMDLSRAILDRGLFHLDNAYYIPHLHFFGQVLKTNTPSNTAFRGFGGPQGMAVIEEVMNRGAEALGLDPAALRQKNYYGQAPRDRTPYGQPVKDCRLERIHDELMKSADYEARVQAVQAFNAQSPWMKRGLGFQPVKFGISFTHAVLNQAGALVLIYADGSVQVNHGGTEMGQGLHTKMRAIAAHELGVPVEQVRIMHTATDKVPNTSATAASSGSDLNGAAVKKACETLRQRLAEVAADKLDCGAEELRFEDGQVFGPESSERKMSFNEVAEAAYLAQVSLSATGYYRTPDIAYDAKKGRGKPFHYFAYGGAVVEVEINGFTGEHHLRRVDILHDVGNPLVPNIDRGQVEGAFIQGLGWLTCEELVTDPQGHLRTHSPDTYKIPALGEAPWDFRVALLEDAPQHDVVHGSKAVGEPPFMLALAAVTALRKAVAAYGDAAVQLGIPCTPEAVLRAVQAQRGLPTD